MKHALLFLTLLAGSAFADTGAVTTTPPTYIPGANGNLSLAPNGGLRIEGNAAGTPVPITGLVSTTPATPSTVTQVIATTECATLDNLNGQAGIGVQVVGLTGTLTGYKSVDGTNFVNARLRAQPIGTAGSGTSITASGSYSIDTSSQKTVKVCGNTGAATVTLRTNPGAEDSIDGLATLVGTAGTPATATITVQPPTESTATATTTVLAGADATISTACTTCAEVWISNNGSATAYITHGATAASGVGIPLIVGATMVEDRYRGAIHAYGTGSITATKVTP